jgi:hypothetical protein
MMKNSRSRRTGKGRIIRRNNRRRERAQIQMRTKERREQKLDNDGEEENDEEEDTRPTLGKPALEANIDRNANEHSGEFR